MLIYYVSLLIFTLMEQFAYAPDSGVHKNNITGGAPLVDN